MAMMPPAAKVPVSGELRTAWVQARRAYVGGNHAEAENLYKTLVETHPDEPDVAGELGNLYYTQGKNAEAAAMYFEAGQRMLRGRTPERAGILLGILNRLDKNKASELRKALFESRRRKN